jgi:hypothetical protein
MLRANFITALLSASALPPWLAPAPGRYAYVAEAPWPMGDHPEAALTFSLRTARPEPDDQTARPADAVGAPIGVRATFVDLASASVARLRVDGVTHDAFARLDRLVPPVPPGTHLVVAGGFGYESLFYPALDAPLEQARSLVTGTRLVALEIGVAPYDPDGMDFIRIHVRVTAGARRGQTGWLPAAYAGLSRPQGPRASTVERACRCRIIEFREP